MAFLAAQKTFEPWQPTNHKCYTNETYLDYVSSWDLSFGENLGRHPQEVTRGRPKTSEKKPKNQFLDPILTISLEFAKNCQISDALPCIAYVVKISNKFDQILWC